MNREIKFRAWNDGEDEQGIPYMIEMKDFNQVKFYEMLVNANKHGLKFMQFTGLKDKNGKDIYEWDIIKFTRRNNKGEYSKGWCGIICWHLDLSWRASNIIDPDDYMKFGSIWGKDIEVIGNTYENPELLNDVKREDVAGVLTE